MDVRKALAQSYIPAGIISAASIVALFISAFVLLAQAPAQPGANYTDTSAALFAIILLPLVSSALTAGLLVWSGYRAAQANLAFDEAALAGASAGAISSVAYTLASMILALLFLFFGPASGTAGLSTGIIAASSVAMAAVNGVFGLFFWALAGSALAALGAYLKK